MTKVPKDYQVKAVKMTDEERNIIGGNIPVNVDIISSLPAGDNIIGQVKITDGTYIAEIDHLGYLVSIEIEHHKVHEGVFYTVADFDVSVDTASPKYWHIITPNTDVRAHAKMQIATDTGGLVELFENPTTTGNGDAIVASNNDRNSTNDATVNFYKDPTVSDDGTRIEVSRIGAGREKKFGGEARQASELILKKNEQYLIKATPDANAAQISLNVGFYEE